MTAPTVYAKCVDCGIDLVDRAAVTAHGSETMAPTGEVGVIARGHRVSIVNPTDEERRASRVRSEVGYALDRLYEELDECVQRADVTAADVRDNLWMFDLRDGWDEYVAEADDD